MVNQVIKLTGSSNHNKCTKADVKDPKAWCYTVDSNMRWEHCSPLCSGPTPTPPLLTRPPSPPSDVSTGTRYRDIAEQVPQIDPRSKYDRKGNCLENCKSRSLSIELEPIEQCGPYECQKPKPHWATIFSWFVPEANHPCSESGSCIDIIGEQFIENDLRF